MVIGKRPRLACGFLSVILIGTSCESPFRTDGSGDDSPLIQLTEAVSKLPITDSSFVDLSWPQAAFDDFSRVEISRVYIAPLDTFHNDLLLRGIITDPSISTWQDTLYDDESVRYKLTVYTLNGPAGTSELDVEVPRTTSILISEGEYTFEWTARSPLIDPGDTLLLAAGTHFATVLDLTDKPVVIKGVAPAKQVIIHWHAQSGGKQIPFFLRVRDSHIENLTFTGGISYDGGAIEAWGQTVIRRCLFLSNTAILKYNAVTHGHGGALFLHDSVLVENCIMARDTAQGDGGAIYVDRDASNVRIINSTFYSDSAYGAGQAIFAPGNPGDITIKNSMITGTGDNIIYPGPDSDFKPFLQYSLAGLSWAAIDTTIVSGEPWFVDPFNNDFHLLEGSPGMDQGDPDPAYNDPDGSRNDLGAYGGPYGNW